MPFLVVLAIVVAVKYGLKLHALWEESENRRIYHKPPPDYPSTAGREDYSLDSAVALLRQRDPAWGEEWDRKRVEQERERRESARRHLGSFETLEAVCAEDGVEWRLARRDGKTCAIATDGQRVLGWYEAAIAKDVHLARKRHRLEVRERHQRK